MPCCCRARVHTGSVDCVACLLLQPGDVLVRVNGEITTSFLPLEAALDETVGRSVRLDLERAGQPLSVDVTVQVRPSNTPEPPRERALVLLEGVRPCALKVGVCTSFF